MHIIIKIFMNIILCHSFIYLDRQTFTHIPQINLSRIRSLHCPLQQKADWIPVETISVEAIMHSVPHFFTLFCKLTQTFLFPLV